MRNHTSSRLTCLALGLVTLALSAAGPPEDPPDLTRDRLEPRYTVARVLDGNTVVLRRGSSRLTVHLLGVDRLVSEPVETGDRPTEEWATAEAATIGVMKNMLEGQSVTLEYETDGKRSCKSGHPSAYLYRSPNRLFVNLTLISRGFGAASKATSRRGKALRDAEKTARAEKRGLWGSQDAARVDDQSATDTPAARASDGELPGQTAEAEAKNGKKPSAKKKIKPRDPSWAADRMMLDMQIAMMLQQLLQQQGQGASSGESGGFSGPSGSMIHLPPGSRILSMGAT
jgi:endonuclease YncB( thermonuclease family)